MGYTIFAFFLSFCVISTVNSQFYKYPPINVRHQLGNVRDGADPGTPLFLTPFVESGNITEGRSLARVPFTENLNITSYAGFFTVDKAYNSNHFFWYFPAISANKDAPVVVWLQGGPGASSLFGLLNEHGPIQVKNGKFERREYNWALDHHIIYIDNPVGTGFSFTSDGGHCRNEDEIGEHLYSTITQFFQLFPELQGNKFYATGEEYAGKFVSAFAYTIHKKNPTAAVKINLKGIAIGDGICDPENQLEYGKYLNGIGLIDLNQAKILEGYENQIKKYIQQQNWGQALDTNSNLFFAIHRMTGGVDIYNYIKPYVWNESNFFEPMLRNSSVRNGIHVGNLTFNRGDLNLKEDSMKSVAPLISELLSYYQVLTYNGQLDTLVAYPLTVNYLQNLNFSGSEIYKTAKRHQWRVGHETAGYVKLAGNLTEIMVRNAGNIVPVDQPEWATDMITRFTHGKSFIGQQEVGDHD